MWQDVHKQVTSITYLKTQHQLQYCCIQGVYPTQTWNQESPVNRTTFLLQAWWEHMLAILTHQINHSFNGIVHTLPSPSRNVELIAFYSVQLTEYQPWWGGGGGGRRWPLFQHLSPSMQLLNTRLSNIFKLSGLPGYFMGTVHPKINSSHFTVSVKLGKVLC